MRRTLKILTVGLLTATMLLTITACEPEGGDISPQDDYSSSSTTEEFSGSRMFKYWYDQKKAEDLIQKELSSNPELKETTNVDPITKTKLYALNLEWSKSGAKYFDGPVLKLFKEDTKPVYQQGTGLKYYYFKSLQEFEDFKKAVKLSDDVLNGKVMNLDYATLGGYDYVLNYHLGRNKSLKSFDNSFDDVFAIELSELATAYRPKITVNGDVLTVNTSVFDNMNTELKILIYDKPKDCIEEIDGKSVTYKSAYNKDDGVYVPVETLKHIIGWQIEVFPDTKTFVMKTDNIYRIGENYSNIFINDVNYKDYKETSSSSSSSSKLDNTSPSYTELPKSSSPVISSSSSKSTGSSSQQSSSSSKVQSSSSSLTVSQSTAPIVNPPVENSSKPVLSKTGKATIDKWSNFNGDGKNTPNCPPPDDDWDRWYWSPMKDPIVKMVQGWNKTPGLEGTEGGKGNVSQETLEATGTWSPPAPGAHLG